MLSKLIHWMTLIDEQPLLSELNAINDQGQTPLHITALNHNIPAYDLPTNGADYSLKDHSGRTAWELHKTRMNGIKYDLLAG
ncbi:hypothetical protein B0O99DRAFT_617842 [Bisporella sp. PMI_857]|nr:hypothetical protein B0O99DRAFT_617842 [Bisporella sp. PMI_857]